jgi:hypothetical protein
LNVTLSEDLAKEPARRVYEEVVLEGGVALDAELDTVGRCVV